MAKKPIDPASPWNPSVCRHLERMAEANEVVISNLESETRERKSLEEKIDKVNATIATLPKEDGGRADQLRQEIKDLKAEHFDVEAEISRLRADRDAYPAQYIAVIKKARQGVLFDADADLIPDEAPAPPPRDVEAEGDKPAGTLPAAEGPAAEFVYPGNFRFRTNKKGGGTTWTGVQNRQALDILVESKLGKAFTLDAGNGDVYREGVVIAKVSCLGPASLADHG